MKRLSIVVLLGLGLVVAGCSSDSPTAPAPSPTPSAYTITLTASPTQAVVGSGMFVQAKVLSGSQNVPDNTTVTFALTGCVPSSATTPHFENGTCEMARTTSAGIATATVLSEVDGTFELTARVPNATQKMYLRWVQPTDPQTLAIYSITPNRSPAQGGVEVTIRGRGFAKPITVTFDPGTGEHTGQVLDVDAAGSQIVVVTPDIGATTQELPTVVKVVAAAGTDNETNASLPSSSFTYEKTFGEPRVYSLEPNRGTWAGGEPVTLYGANLVPPLKVTFGSDEAQVSTVASDYTRATVLTPRHSNSINSEQVVGVTVISRDGTQEQQTYTMANAYTFVPDSGVPLLYSVTPNKGTPRGGEMVTLTGKNLFAPVTVAFGLGSPLSGTLQAQVLNVAADGSSVTIVTPQASPNPVTTDVDVNISITNRVGANNSQSASYPNVFTYVGESRPPLIYYLDPNRGSARGGESVTIHGAYFIKPVTVLFTPGGQAQVTSVADNGTTAQIVTPAYSAAPLEGDDVSVNVTVTTQSGTGRDEQATLAGGFVYAADQPTPELYSLTPSSGPLDGGTRVVITGKGFQYPVQVVFGTLEAQVVSVNFNQVICISPKVTVQNPGSPYPQPVKVTNMLSGKSSNTLTFNYGSEFFISGFTPSDVPMHLETPVTIYGQGFFAPLRVYATAGSAVYDWQVLSVAGTEIRALVPPIPQSARTCGSISATVTVQSLESQALTASLAGFTYRASRPMITSIEIDNTDSNLVTQYDPYDDPLDPTDPVCSSAWGSHTVTITGSGFEQRVGTEQSAMTVRFAGVANDFPTNFINDTTLRLTLPDLTAIDLNEIACTTSGGSCGSQYVDTGVDVTVTNEVNACADTLASALVIRPCDRRCRAPIAPVSITLSAGPYHVGTAITGTLAFTPTPAPSTTQMELTYTGFDATPAGITIVASTTSPYVFAFTPATAGTGQVIVTNTCGIAVASVSINVLPPIPVVSLVNPATGVAAGGTSVTITGNYFTGATSVTFGGLAAANVVVDSDTSITCDTPPHAVGAVAVAVTTPGGTGTLAGGFTYTP